MHFAFLLLLPFAQRARSDILVKTKQGTQFLAFTKNNSRTPGSGTDYRDEASSEEDYKDYIDYSNEEDEWLDKCSFVKNSGKMKQKDIPSQGGSIHIKCSGGCINIHKVIFIFPKKVFPFLRQQRCYMPAGRIRQT